ncbi:hypothetical protein OHS33_13775 [Streptomyces sp. NBC_00536]|uniref:hypothetical protein n=1 Tax=Streptomyces sp. NBC_00536 TaxID=2975769 RepID=UPI002E80E30D|nr:hypothetical protein [Streptomyces sp. NBC_00536]WUC79311.1 hypothetical protein OHS33_13775 [Streptomyces sp. NBC_00536]
MLTFENVMNAPLEQLQTAVQDWGAMAKKLTELAESARTGMRAKADKADWKGVNADVTKPFVAKTAKEFDDAAKEAEGVHLALSDGHATFTAARDQLKKIVDVEAPAAGFQVDATGRVTPVPIADAKERYAAQHDPDYQQLVREHHDAWQARVDRAVEDCADADDSLARVLQANITDDHNFTTPKYTTLDAEQVDRAAELMKKVTGEGGTARNVAALRELEDLLDDNRDDPEFATGFYRKVGPEATLQMYAEMSLDSSRLGPAGADRTAMVGNIQSDLGAMLGLATHKDVPNHLDAAWTTQLMKAGRKQLDVGLLQKVYGYQALGSLLREGTYDKDFLTSVGRDMVAMDNQNPKIWEHTSLMDPNVILNHGADGSRGFYPLTGLMEALGNNPDAATAFFNEPVRQDTNGDGIVTTADKVVSGQHGKAQGMVDYMLDKQPYVDDFDTTRIGELHPAQEAVGGALEAAVSGRVAGDEDAKPVPHTKGMADIMERVVEKIGDKPQLVYEDGPLNGLSGHFGQMTAEYMPDIQAAAENGGKQIKVTGVMADFNKSDVARFLGAVAQDPEAYGAITNANQAFTGVLVNDVIVHRADYGQNLDGAIENAVHPGGQIAGMMTEARAENLHATTAHSNEEYAKGVEDQAKWINRGISAAGGKYLELVPLAGDVVGWVQEDVTEHYTEAAEKTGEDKTAATQHKVSQLYADAERRTSDAVAGAVTHAAQGSGLSEAYIGVLAGSASKESKVAHSVGRDLVATAAGSS